MTFENGTKDNEHTPGKVLGFHRAESQRRSLVHIRVSREDQNNDVCGTLSEQAVAIQEYCEKHNMNGNVDYEAEE